jgi:hypothetical protein
LNTGRLTLPASAVGATKAMIEVTRRWSNERVQWGQPIGKHEAIAHKLADMAASAFAMESITETAADMADRPDYDIRLEAAAAKEWNTVRAWNVIDDALEIRGGRGFETERSLAARGEVPIGIERMMRDARINRIFEGSSEIMHLFMAREAVDRHLQIAGPLIDPKASMGAKLVAAMRGLAFYLFWYPRLWVGWSWWPRFRSFGRLAPHVRFVDRATRKLARSIFHGMVVYRGGLERRQGFLFRMVDIAMALFAMICTVTRARRMKRRRPARATEAESLADVFCRVERRKVRGLFTSMWSNDDRVRYATGLAVLEGRYAWLESGIVALGVNAEALTPRAPIDSKPAEEELYHDRAAWEGMGAASGARMAETASPRAPRAH